MVRPISFIKLLVVFSLLSYTAQADEPLIPVKFTGHYDFALSGLLFGKLDIGFTQDAASYTAVADVKTAGIASIFIDHTSHTTSNGSGSNFVYPVAHYESRYQTRKKPKYVKMEMKDGAFISEIVEPADNRATRPAVATSDKMGALDPLAFGLAIRSRFKAAIDEGTKQFSINYYDGRRLTRVDFTVGSEKIIRLRGNKYPVYSLTARRKALAGYTQKEQERIGPKDPILTIYFSRDARFLPIRLEVPMAFGVASATLRM